MEYMVTPYNLSDHPNKGLLMQMTRFLTVIVTTTMLAACAQPGGRGVTEGGSGFNKTEVGTIGGAIAGGVIGNQIGGGSGRTVATIGGALLGGFLGNQVGRSLDNADRAMVNQTTQSALETSQPGQSLPWRNTNSGNYGSITPSNYYQNAEGQYCREYTQTIVVGGKTEKGYGTACRQPDGSWQMVSN